MTELTIERLTQIVVQLQGLYSDLAFHKKAELLTKRDAWLNSTESSQAGRDRSAQFAAAEHTIAIWQTEAEINSLIEEKWLIRTVLDKGLNAS